MPKPRIAPVTRRPRIGSVERKLEETLYALFLAAEPWSYSFKDLSDASGVCLSTVYRLYNRESPNVRYATIWKLCRAVGCDLAFIQPKQKSKRRVA